MLCVAAGWAMAAAIIGLSLTPSPPEIGIEEGDKIGHVAAYGALMLWFCLLYPRNGTRLAYAALWTVMGIALEFAQGETGYRSYELFDMVANATGVLSGWAISFAIPVGLARKLR
jgi:VanZ family protein